MIEPKQHDYHECVPLEWKEGNLYKTKGHIIGFLKTKNSLGARESVFLEGSSVLMFLEWIKIDNNNYDGFEGKWYGRFLFKDNIIDFYGPMCSINFEEINTDGG